MPHVFDRADHTWSPGTPSSGSHAAKPSHSCILFGAAALGVALWAVSNAPAFERCAVWPYFAAWIVVATGAAGVYGFTRSMPGAVTATRRPPTGAAREPTAKL